VTSRHTCLSRLACHSFLFHRPSPCALAACRPPACPSAHAPARLLSRLCTRALVHPPSARGARARSPGARSSAWVHRSPISAPARRPARSPAPAPASCSPAPALASRSSTGTPAFCTLPRAPAARAPAAVAPARCIRSCGPSSLQESSSAHRWVHVGALSRLPEVL
jgi:hypothetical protein